MNRTLFDCGFKKEVELKNGKLYDVTATLPKAVQKQTYDFKCGICSGGGGTPIHYLYGYVPPNGVVILKLLI